MRISDWSSDVCSSDLERYAARVELRPGSFDGAGYAGVDGDRLAAQRETSEVERRQVEDVVDQVEELLSATAYVGGVFAGAVAPFARHQIGRASCRERVCQCV